MLCVKLKWKSNINKYELNLKVNFQVSLCVLDYHIFHIVRLWPMYFL